ncbi:MAG: hypothetical protein L3K10_07405 [Thermoplasmata archaeon]|nr:hypothetical protein [Thermoplasmata archaeon]
MRTELFADRELARFGPFQATHSRLPDRGRRGSMGWVVGLTLFLVLAWVGFGVGATAHGIHPASGAVPVPAPTPLSGIPPHHLTSLALNDRHPMTGLPSAASWLAYDHSDHSYFVAAPPSSVDIIDALSTVLGINATVSVGTDPFGVAVDNQTGTVFVTNGGSGNVSVLQGYNITPFASVTVGTSPSGVAFDSANGDVYVANEGSDSVTVLNATTLTIVATIGVGSAPLGISVAAPSNEIFVANYGSSSVSILNGSNQQLVATVGVGDEPYGVAYDNLTNNIYVTNEGSNNVSVLSAASLVVVADIAVPGFGGPLQGIAYDSGDQMLWAGAGSLYAVVLNPSNESVAAYVGIDPSGVTYNPDNGDVCVTNTANRTFECIAFPNFITSPSVLLTITETGLPLGTLWSVGFGWDQPTVSSTTTVNALRSAPNLQLTFQVSADGAAYAATPSSGVVVTGSTSNLNVTFVRVSSVFPVDFSEAGLTPGTSWWVDFGGQAVGSTSSWINFTEPVGNYTYEIEPVPGSSPTFGTGSVFVNGSATTIPVVFTVGSSYFVQFYESTLPQGTAWSVTLSSNLGSQQQLATGGSIVFMLANGTYNYSISVLGNASYSATTPSGSFTIAGTATNFQVQFVSTTPTSGVTFTESGLPTGSWWVVTLNGTIQNSTSTNLSFFEPNGTYSYRIANVTVGGTTFVPGPATGMVVVAGASVNVVVGFGPTGSTYTVTFSEAGLPVGTAWAANFAGNRVGSTGNSLNFTAANGSYNWSVPGSAGYAPSPSSGQVVVNGANASVSVTFSQSNTSYPVTLTETGLPNGTGWSATLGGSVGSSNNAMIGFSEPNGSYSLAVAPVANYSANYSTSVGVNGGPVAVGVAFTNSTFPVPIGETGLPTGSSWAVAARNVANGISTVGQSTGTGIVLHLGDGTYALSATGPSGYRASLSGTTVVVQGAGPVGLSVTFTPTGPGGTTPESLAIPLVVEVSIITALLVSVVAAWGFSSYRFGQRRAEGEQWVKELRSEGRDPDDKRTR